MNAELNIQLRLLLDQVQGDAQKAAEIIKKTMSFKEKTGNQIADTHPDVVAAKVANKILLDGTKTRSSAQISVNKVAQQIEFSGVKKIALERMNAIKSENALKLNAARVLTEEARKERIDIQSGIAVEKFTAWKSQYRGPKPPVLSKIGQSEMRDKEAFYKNMSMLAGPIFSPGGGLSTMFAARQVFSAMRTDKGKGLQSMVGLGTGIGGSAIATGGLVAAATAIGVSLKSFQVALEQSIKAIRFSSSLYSKSMTSGLGIKTEASRTILSSVLGVSEKDIFRFGAAIGYLAPKIKTATDAIAKATIPLATLDINFKVLQTNMMALAATLVEKATPALMTFLNALNTLTEFAIKNAGTIFGLARVAAKTGLSAVFGNAKVELIAALLGKMVDANSKSEGGRMAPSPASFMKQMPASNWERMGLVIGGGGGTNYAQQTAEATKRSAKFLEFLAKGHFNTSNPFNPIPSTP